MSYPDSSSQILIQYRKPISFAYYNLKMMPSIKPFITLLLYFTAINGHDKRVIDLQPIPVIGAINQSIIVHFQYNGHDKIFSGKTQIPEDQKYVTIKPATVKLNIQNITVITPFRQQSVLEDLRNKKSSSYRHILSLNDSLIIYMEPDIVVSYKIGGTKQFEKNGQYGIPNLINNSETHLYELGQNSGLMTVNNHNQFYVIYCDRFRKLAIDKNVSISYLELIDDRTIITAEKQKGIRLYDLNIKEGSAKIITQLKCEDFELGQKCSITDLKYNRDKKILHFLDSDSGVHKFYMQEQATQSGFIKISDEKEPEIIASIVGCQIMDFLSYDHFVLICKDIQSFNPYIIQIVQLENPVLGTKTFVKKEPMYHPCNFQDLIVTDQYYLAYNKHSLDIFWNSVENGIYLTEMVNRNMNLPNLQVFTFKQEGSDLYMYAVMSPFLYKIKINVFNGEITIHTKQPVHKEIKLLIDGTCPESISQNKKTKGDSDKYHTHPKPNSNNEYSVQQCTYSQKILLSIEESKTNRHIVSITLGFIILMILIVIILAFICCTKYSAMEGYLRNMLNQFKRKRQKIKPIEL